jgi:hypothetical protein
MDMADKDLEAAYVNYVRAMSIIVEVIPRHKGMEELREARTVTAIEYWDFRKVNCNNIGS